jgi:hypothetical protein
MKHIKLPAILIILVFTSSCTLFNTPPEQAAPSELSDFRATYLTSFDIMNDSFNQSGRALMPFNLPVVDESQARATVPVGLDDSILSIPLPVTFGQIAVGDLSSDYPEAGQRTSWTIENMGSNLYRIKVLTTFPSYDPREEQEEWYYIKDQTPGDPGTPDNSWTNADPVVDNTGALDQKYRELNKLTYRDGSYQDEVIVDIRNNPDGFAPFDVAGSLDYPDAFLPLDDTNAVYSSVVVYSRIYNDEPAYSFWSGQRAQGIVGIRYYTEYLNFIGTSPTPSHVIGSMVVFEKAITSMAGIDGDFLSANSSLYLPYIGLNPEQTFLALSVIRQETTFSIATYDAGDGSYTVDYDLSTRDTRAKSRVVNIPAQQDNYISLINDEAEAISTAYDSLWIPNTNDPYYLNPGTAPLVNIKTTNFAISTDDTAAVEIITDSPEGDLGTLYVSVSNAAIGDHLPINALDPVAQDIVGDLSGVGDYNTFTGSQGILIPDPVDGTYAFNDKGTVQAWVYVDKQSRDAGIVHAGVLPDFSDEVWSLQFVGTNNTPAFALVAQGPKYAYDMVQSSDKLKKSTWYHLAATWDRSANNMSIYVNGVSKGSRTFSNIKSTSTFAVDSPVVVGSQFYDATQVLSGYYGTDGKINGVLIENRAWTAAEVKTFYDANKAKTAFW